MHLYLLIVFTFSYLWTDVKDCMKSSLVFSDLLVVFNLRPAECWILRVKKYLTSLSSKSVVRSPKSVVLSTKSESKVQNPNFLTKAGTISLGLELEFRVWQKRGHWLDLRRVIKKCGIFHNSIHQRALGTLGTGHSGSNQRAIRLDCVIPSEPKIPHLVVKLRSRSRLVKGQVKVRWGSGRSESGLSHVNSKT